MLINYIIPCGTSQIEKYKLNLLSVNGNTSEVIEDAKRELLEKEAAYLANEDVIGAIDDIVNNLIQSHIRRCELVPPPPPIKEDWFNDNPYGAELSTLIRLEEKSDSAQQTSGSFIHDRFVLLSSETRSGILSKRVIRQYLIHESGYQVPCDHVIEHTIQNLTEYQVFPETAMKDLASKVCAELKPTNLQERYKNVIIITGGFKSIIPCLTIIALLYGIELVYLFEQSTRIERMNFINQSTPNQNKLWRKFWIHLSKKGWVTSETICLKSIIDEWLGFDKRIFPGPIFG